MWYSYKFVKHILVISKKHYLQDCESCRKRITISCPNSKGLFQPFLFRMFCFTREVRRLFATLFFARVLSPCRKYVSCVPVLWERRRVSYIERIARTRKKEKERNRPVSILRSIPSPASPYPHRSDFTIGTRCRPILHFIPRGWVASRGARTILLDVTFPPCETLDLSPHPFRSDRKGLQMAAISACIDSWNWEDLLVSGVVSSSTLR